MFEKLKYGFLHIQKTAGSSFEEYLKEHFYLFVSHNRIEFSFEDPQFVNNLDNIEILSGHLRFYDFLMMRHDIKVITFLREPISRTISQYFNHKKWFELEGYDFPTVNSWQEFKDILLFSNSHHTKLYISDYDNSMTRSISGIGPSYATYKVNEYILELAKRNLDRMFFVGFKEHFNESVIKFFELTRPDVDIKKDIKLFNHQRMAITPNDYDPTEADLKVITSLNYYDLKLYEHALEKFSKF